MTIRDGDGNLGAWPFTEINGKVRIADEPTTTYDAIFARFGGHQFLVAVVHGADLLALMETLWLMMLGIVVGTLAELMASNEHQY